MANVVDMTGWSHKAMMSVKDADLLEELLLKLAKKTGKIKVLEWGSGRSTKYYPYFLRNANLGFHWTSVEYDKKFFNDEFEHFLREFSSVSVQYCTKETEQKLHYSAEEFVDGFNHVRFIVFDYGRLQPFLDEHADDRKVNMDDYIQFPCDESYDLILVDGRHRRECLIQASKHLNPGGIVVLHDAQREYYHCAFEHYKTKKFIGDMLWIGSNADLEEIL